MQMEIKTGTYRGKGTNTEQVKYSGGRRPDTIVIFDDSTEVVMTPEGIEIRHETTKPVNDGLRIAAINDDGFTVDNLEKVPLAVYKFPNRKREITMPKHLLLYVLALGSIYIIFNELGPGWAFLLLMAWFVAFSVTIWGPRR